MTRRNRLGSLVQPQKLEDEEMTAKPKSPIENDLQIGVYMHCGRCLNELPKEISPASWARLSVGFTSRGIQVWCNRREVNVCHIDFEGHKHPANTTIKAEE